MLTTRDPSVVRRIGIRSVVAEWWLIGLLTS